MAMKQTRLEPALLRARREALAASAWLPPVVEMFSTALHASPPSISRRQYTLLHRRIAKVLAPELTDEEARQAAAEDWWEDLQVGARFVGRTDPEPSQAPSPSRSPSRLNPTWNRTATASQPSPSLTPPPTSTPTPIQIPTLSR